MSINFLDSKNVFIFSLLQYSTAMILKSSRVINIHYPYKSRRDLDYNYKDWEENKPDIYDYLIPSTNQTAKTASDIFTETSTKESFFKDIPENLTLGISQLNTAYPTLPSTESTPDTSLPTPDTEPTSDTSFPTPDTEPTPDTSFPTPDTEPTPDTSLPTPDTSLPIPDTVPTPDTALPIPDTDSTVFPSTPYNTTASTLITDYFNGSVVTITTQPSTETTLDPDNQLIRDEIEEARVKLRGGIFTASVYVLLKIIEKKKSSNVQSLLHGLKLEFHRLNANDELAVFGPMVSTVFTSLVDMMATAPIELIQLQSKNGQELIENKKEAFQSDTKAFFMVVDAIYTEEDYINIVESLKNIQNFPNVPKLGKDVAREAMEAFIFLPYSRVSGTGKGILLLNEIHIVVEKRMFIDNVPMRPHFRKYFKISTEMKMSSENINEFENTKFTKAQIKNGFVEPALFAEPTTISSFKSDYKSYVPKGMKRLGHKIKIYTDKFRQSSSKERTFKTNRGLMSTTTTITTKATRFTWRLFSKNRKFMDRHFETKKYLLPNSSSNNEDFYSDSDDENYGTDAIQTNVHKSMATTKFKNTVMEGKEFKIIKDLNKIRRFENKSESTDSSAESYLQINLNDALFHTNNITIDRRFMKKRVNKLRNLDSFSDDEAILKSNIYKAFGYSKDFAKELKAIL